VTGTVLQGIVGTAGHVDHGKTSLVKALTGCDTDRLPEEKARGMSIDLGFAPCVLRETGAGGAARRMVGIVDVPGHRDFIRNMVAGAASMDVLLLVIAADDGVMPQTDEHMKIVRLLRQPRVMVALTKIDMVSPERLEAVKGEVAAFLEQVGFAGAPIVPVSNKTFDGVGEVLAEIDRLVAEVQGRGADDRAFRMSVERVFSVAGYGTVVTGIPVSGAIRVGEKVELLPTAGREQTGGNGGREWVVRTVQMYKTESPAALASCCCAINLRDLGAEQVGRGMVIGMPGMYRATTEMIVAVENATGGETGGAQPWKRRFEARLHTGTAAVEASVKMLVPDGELAAGTTGLAHVKLAEPAVVAAGDRFILRSMSPSETLGGGIVLSAQRQRLRRHADVAARWDAARMAALRGDVLAAELLAGPAALLAGTEVLRLTQCAGETARAKVAHAVQTGLIVDLGGGAYAVAPRIGEVSAVMERVLERYHRTNPMVGGMMPSLVCKMAGVDVKNFAALAELLSGGGTLLCRNGRLALARFKPALGERLTGVRERLLEAIARAGVHAPARGNLMRDLAIVEGDMKVLEKSLLEERAICVLDGNYMGRAVYEEARGRLLALFEKVETVELGAFRDALGTNRKVALALLDAFDAEGLTRRVANGRVLARKRG
jgi:selenocysteine-specific elongation factor